MQLELLRMSLLERRQIDAFAERAVHGGPFNREQWLRRVFSYRIEFEHRKETFYYVPEPSADSPILIGRVGRQVSVQENEPPDAGLQETKRDAWRAALVLIDPRHHDDGQKIACEHEPRVGQPPALFESLVAYINRRDPPSPFVIEVHTISDARDFWAFVQENKGSVTLVTFELVAPNMFGTEDNYDIELRDMKEKERVRRVKLQIENSDGLELETQRVRAAVDYAVRGGGSIRANTKGHRKFNSRSKAERVSVPEKTDEETSPINMIKRAVSIIFKQ
jgi:hypothetical protein